MRLIFHLLLTFFITYGDSSLLNHLKDSITNLFEHTNVQSSRNEDPKEGILRFKIKDSEPPDDDKYKKRFIKRVREEPLKTRAKRLHNERKGAMQKKKHPLRQMNKRPMIRRKKIQHFRMDPVLNSVIRRTGNLSRRYLSDSSLSSSSSLELKGWKDEWREHWVNKKIEAIKSQGPPRGDAVNMVAARPWGVPCGDPDQHDMPWGTCMMAMECDPEYRIYRGDYFCGRTQFVCCAIQLTNYDMYEGFDVSFQDSALSTDTEERKDRDRGSREKRRRKRYRDKKRRRRQRMKRKKKIRNNIRKIIKEMRKILNRSYRNGTADRKKKTRQLKKFIKDLKRKYKSDRKVVSVIHETDLLKIDNALMKKLDDIKLVNSKFLKNNTFREIVMNGTMTKQSARMLVEAYPELAADLNDKLELTRRSGGKDSLDYDIEYGMLYY